MNDQKQTRQNIYRYEAPLTAQEACKWAGVSLRTLYRLTKTGLGTKVGGHWYFSQKELARYFLGKNAEDSRVA